MKHQLYNGDCLDVLETLEPVDTLFADPPDNIGLGYDSYRDKLKDGEYVAMLRRWLNAFVLKARTVWFSYNSKWTFEVGKIVTEIVGLRAGDLEAKPCVQTFTFGQHNHHDLGNNHRPLLRLRWRDAPLYPDAIRVPSHGGKRTATSGPIPAGASPATWLQVTVTTGTRFRCRFGAQRT